MTAVRAPRRGAPTSVKPLRTTGGAQCAVKTELDVVLLAEHVRTFRSVIAGSPDGGILLWRELVEAIFAVVEALPQWREWVGTGDIELLLATHALLAARAALLAARAALQRGYFEEEEP